MSCRARWWVVTLVTVWLAAASCAFGQPLAEQTIEIDGETIRYSIRAFPAGASVVDSDAVIEPVSALDTAKLLNRFLTAGKVEEAALLSNSPRRRFEILTDYKNSVGED